MTWLGGPDYDLNAMRAHGRILIRDPNGDAISDAEWRDNYINPAYEEWWRNFEERPGQLVGPGPATISPGMRTQGIPTPGGDFNDVVYRLTIQTATVPLGREEGVRQTEFNRIRDLQETEGRIGRPDQWAHAGLTTAGVPTHTFAFYPLPDQIYYVNLYGRPHVTLLGLGSDIAQIDPVSQRRVTRIASYRAGLDLKIRGQQLDAIIRPLPAWVRAHFAMDYSTQGKALDQADTRGYARIGG